MARIKQLSAQEAQKIAAGEVVERPANVVKELVENALDAGASSISIFIEEAGKVLIRVVDNGCGMSEEDARLCFLHHATSKITSVHDLANLVTFGFRGEALSSISSISKVTLITREHDASHGTQVILEHGVVVSQEPVSSASGTDISIRDLFYNVPARKKFLKTNDTEWRQIVSLFQAFCLSYQQVHFRLSLNGSELFNCPPVTALSDRILQLWDHRMAQHMITVAHDDKITITGLISDHNYFRYDRSQLFFFVNGRWVKNGGLSKALCKGYLNVLPADRFPAGCIAITIDQAQVDINIHPRKEEVQFLQPRVIEVMLQDLVKKTLESHVSKQLNRTVQFAPPKPLSFAMPAMPQALLSEPPPFMMQSSITHDQPSLAVANHTTMPATSSYDAQGFESFEKNFLIIGQLHKTYIILEHPEGCFLVDQHAAHERVLYERFGIRFDDAASISLLFPQLIQLSASDCALVLTHQRLFKELGIELEEFGQSQIKIVATPVQAKNISFQEVIHQAASIMGEHAGIAKDQLQTIVHHEMRAMMACKAAVKAGDELTMIQMTQLLDDLIKTNNRFTCPHGRPTSWLIRLDEIEKKFKRKV